VRRRLHGRKDGGDLSAIHASDLIRAADKAIPGVDKAYSFLSETAHPNFAGTTNPFVKIEED
jgi:hypothetical protein